MNGSSIGIFNESYDMLRLLGKGTTSKVYLCRRHSDSLFVALKVFDPEFFVKGGDVAKKVYIQEIGALLKLKHPNIVEMYEYGIDGVIRLPHELLRNVWFIVLEYVPERTLSDLIKTFGIIIE